MKNEDFTPKCVLFPVAFLGSGLTYVQSIICAIALQDGSVDWNELNKHYSIPFDTSKRAILELRLQGYLDADGKPTKRLYYESGMYDTDITEEEVVKLAMSSNEFEQVCRTIASATGKPYRITKNRLRLFSAAVRRFGVDNVVGMINYKAKQFAASPQMRAFIKLEVFLSRRHLSKYIDEYLDSKGLQIEKY